MYTVPKIGEVVVVLHIGEGIAFNRVFLRGGAT